MKRIVSVLLVFVMLVGIIPISMVTASAASSEENWEEVFCSTDWSNNTIQIFKKDVKRGVRYISQAKFLINGYEEYKTQKFTAFFTPYTLKDICTKKDWKLKRAEVWEYIEKIEKEKAVVQVMKEFSAEAMAEWSVAHLEKEIYNIAKDFRKDMANDVAIKSLGLRVPTAFEITTETVGWITNAMGMVTFGFNVLNIWTYQAQSALGNIEAVEKAETRYSDKIDWDTYYLCTKIKDL